MFEDETKMKFIPFDLPVLLLRSPFEQSDRFARLLHACRECEIEVQMVRKDGTVTIIRAGQSVVQIRQDSVEPPGDPTRH